METSEEKTPAAPAPESEQARQQPPAAAPKPAAEGTISFDDFKRVELRVAQIEAAERITKSEKLVKLQVSLGAELGMRQIVAGIGKHFTPEELVGRKIAVVANLAPAKLMGEMSQGMLLAASDDAGNLELVSVGAAMPPGAVIR